MATNASSDGGLASLQHPSAVSKDTLPDPAVSEKGSTDSLAKDDDLSIPDGGHGWIVLTGCAVVSWWTIGTAQSFGVLQSALLDAGVSSSVNLMFVGSLAAGLVAAFAILYAKAMRTFGTRTAALSGVFLMSLSGAISSVVYTNIGALFVAYGLMMGVGMGLTFTTVSVAPTQYFLRRRGLANGIVLAGGGAGGAVISVALQAIIQRLGVAWALRIHCLLVAGTGLPAAFVIQERVPYKHSGLVDWTLFRSKTFVLLFLAGVVGMFPSFVPPYCMPRFVESIGLSSSTGAGMVAAFNAASAVGRISSGFLSDKLGVLNVLFMSMVLLGTSMFVVWPFASSLGVSVLFVILAGMAVGGFLSSMPTAVGTVFGTANMSVTMGMIITGWTGGYTFGAPVASYILEASGGADNGLAAFRPSMYFAGSMALISATLVAVVRLRKERDMFAKT